jgi:hypothetical protein
MDMVITEPQFFELLTPFLRLLNLVPGFFYPF